MTSRSLFQRAVCALLSLVIAVQPVCQTLLWGMAIGAINAPLPLLAQELPPTAPRGAAEGKELGESLLHGPSSDGTNIYFNGANGTESIETGSFFQSAGSEDDVQAMMDAFGDDNAATALSSAVATRLAGENSQQADAVRTVRESSLSRSHPDLGNDPIFNRSREILDGEDPIFDTFFEGCESTDVPVGGGSTVHVPDDRYCGRVITPTEQCEVSHVYEVSQLMRVLGGQGSMTSCGPDCVEITVGTERNTNWRANCQIFEETFSIAVDTPEAITSATVTFAHYDDYLHFYVGGERLFAGPDDRLPPEIPGRCDTGNHDTSLNIDLTPQFQNTPVLTFRNRVSVTVRGEAWVKIRVHYDPARLVRVDQWTVPPECNALLTGVADGACNSQQVQCLDGPQLDVPCLTIDGVEVCQDRLAPSPIPGLSNLCRRGQITANCNFMVGPMQCWTDPQGVEHCPQNNGDNPNGCAIFEDNPSCAFISSQCLPFAQGNSGRCYAYEEHWDCGTDVAIPGGTAHRMSCDGPIRCMGEECVSPTRETNPDFGKAAATLSAMTFMSMEMNCVDGNPETCSIFGGEPMECKQALGGYQDCCNTPVGVGLADYLKLTMSSYKLAKQMEVGTRLANAGLNVPGAWNAIRNYASQSLSTITRPFTSAWGSLTQSYGGAAVDAIESFSLEALKEQMTRATAEFVADTFGTATAEMFFGNAAEEGTGEFVSNGALSEGFATALNVVMWVYTIYVIVNILIDIIWACEEEEFTLAARREMQSCTYLGSYCYDDTVFGCIERRQSYCCYNSPLARIVMEGAVEQLGLDRGDPETPNCQGLTVAQVASLDWERIDLEQWYGLLAANGVLPNSEEAFNTQYALDNATRNQDARSFVAPSAPERVQNQVEAAEHFDEAREQVREDLWDGAR